MGIAISLKKYLENTNTPFELISHDYSAGASNTAKSANIAGASLAKGVLLRDEDFHYTLCALPADHQIRRHTLNQILDRRLSLADEDELQTLFKDCEQGAVPALGKAYGLHVLWEDDLLENEAIFIEAGDHRHLIRLSRENFEQLMGGELHEHFSCKPTASKRQRLKKLKNRTQKMSELEYKSPSTASYTEALNLNTDN